LKKRIALAVAAAALIGLGVSPLGRQAAHAAGQGFRSAFYAFYTQYASHSAAGCPSGKDCVWVNSSTDHVTHTDTSGVDHDLTAGGGGASTGNWTFSGNVAGLNAAGVQTVGDANTTEVDLALSGTARLKGTVYSTDGMTIADSGGSARLLLSTNNGTSICYAAGCMFIGGLQSPTLQSGAGDGGLQASVQANTAQSVAGGVGWRIDMDVSGINNPSYGITTGAGIYAEVGTRVNVSGTVSVGDVCVWVSGTANTVARSSATNNLTTIAGIATASQTGGQMYLVTHGRALVNAQAGITVGQLVGTSSVSAGTIQSGTAPGAGAIVGRALESTGATQANKVIVYVTL
jgi:hypothetical protein